MIEYMLNFKFNSLIGILMYWVPLLFCAVFYTLRCAGEYQNDLVERAEFEKEERRYYQPTISIGTIIGRGICTIFPVVNIWCAALDLAPQVLGKFFKWIDRVFDRPLVPKRK